MLLAGLAGLLTGCQTPTVSSPCPRDTYWKSGEMQMLERYWEAVVEAFDYTTFEGPQNNTYIWERLNALERYCWQMRRKDD